MIGGEEINARIRIEHRPLADLRDAFDLEDYPVDGTLSGEFHVYGPYTRPFGFGRMTIADGSALRRTFFDGDRGPALRRQRRSSRCHRHRQRQRRASPARPMSAGTAPTRSTPMAAASPVETLAVAAFPELPPLTGLVDFSAGAAATFDEPRYDVRLGVQDLFFGDEGVGEVTGTPLGPRRAPHLRARSGIGAAGRLWHRTDCARRLPGTPSCRFASAIRRSTHTCGCSSPTCRPYTTAVASGTIRVVGELYNRDALRIATSIEQLDLRLVDYRLRNQGPIELTVEGQTLRLDSFGWSATTPPSTLPAPWICRGRRCRFRPTVPPTWPCCRVSWRDLRSSGRADVSALIGGTAARPIVSGQAMITDGPAASLLVSSCARGPERRHHVQCLGHPAR